MAAVGQSSAQRRGEARAKASTCSAYHSAAFAEHGQAGAAVFTALVVVGGGGQQVIGERLQALLIGRVEIGQRCAELLGTEAHVVARQQHRRAIERGVFHGFGGGRRGQLLEAHAGMLEQLALAAEPGASRHGWPPNHCSR